MRIATAVAAVAFVLLAAPAASSAGTVLVDLEEVCTACDAEAVNVTYRGEPGEANRVSFISDGTKVVIRDDGAPVSGGNGWCVPDDQHQVTCRVTAATSYGVFLGDADDRLEFAGADASLRGGPGNDEIISKRAHAGRFTVFGDAGDDRLVSGALDEELYGGTGNDALEGGEGSDRLDGGTGADRMDGGPGDFDSVEYGTRREDVRVDLAGGTAGAAGEGDTVANVEGAVTGPGDDVLIGTDGANELISGAGRDRIDGRGGADHVSTQGAARSIRCGDGRDTAMTNRAETVIEADCESASGADLVPARAQPVLRGGAAIAEVRVVERRRTRGTVVLTAGPRGAVLGTGDAAAAFRRSALARVRVPLTPVGRTYFRRGSGKLVTVSARLRDADGAFTNRWTIRLR